MPRPPKVNVSERFAAFLSNHADPQLGITNDFVSAACKWICPQIARKERGANKRSVYFSGVYGSDELATAERKAKGKVISTYIVNVEDPENPSSGHFIFIQRDKLTKKTYYMDSFGRDCADANVIEFLSQSPGDGYQYICEPIQNPASTACGLYTMLYTLAREADMNFETDFDFLPPKKADDGAYEGRKENDKRCIWYINNILSKYLYK